MIYIYIWHKRFDVNFTLIFTLVPIACIGYLLFSTSRSLGEALCAQRIIYLGGCFLQLFILSGILNLCGIQVTKFIKIQMFFICAFMYILALSMGYTDLFYKNVSFDIENGHPVLIKEYGPAHTVFYALIIAFFVIGLFTIAYSLIRKSQIPRR
ncbi:MAG: hypothetical protein IKN07_11695, partial [Lachnospiraceae bacterium]|nr:hypothetical protein [Lachnospiraceae bacterium]